MSFRTPWASLRSIWFTSPNWGASRRQRDSDPLGSWRQCPQCNKDLEILPGPSMTLEGAVHTNGDLYVGGDNQFTIEGQVTTAGSLFHCRKDEDECMVGVFRSI